MVKLKLNNISIINTFIFGLVKMYFFSKLHILKYWMNLTK